MLDAAFLQIIEPPLPPELPQLAMERVWLSPFAEQAKRQADRLLRDWEERFTVWKKRIDDLRSIMTAMAASHAPNDGELAELTQLIAELEEHAEARATRAVRLEMRVRREVKRQFGADPSLASVMRAFGERLIQIDREIVDEILDHALFLRAFRSDHVPSARGGQVFDNAAELERFLAAELA